MKGSQSAPAATAQRAADDPARDGRTQLLALDGRDVAVLDRADDAGAARRAAGGSSTFWGDIDVTPRFVWGALIRFCPQNLTPRSRSSTLRSAPSPML